MKKINWKKLATFFVLSVLGIMPLISNAGKISNEKTGGGIYNITSPPKELKLDPFYKKYVNVNGIHIISSYRVPDSAFVVACSIIDFMTNGLPQKVLEQMVILNTRVGIMARYEGTTDIPEHAHLAKDTTLNWDVRARIRWRFGCSADYLRRGKPVVLPNR